MIFIGISTWTWYYALWPSIAIPHELGATLYDLQLQFPHDLDATLYDLHWHFHMNLMLRSMTFNCNSTWSWCYALWSSLAFPHEPDVTLYDLQLQFHMILMLRSMIFIGISTWTWCYSLWSSLAFPHETWLLRSMIFIGVSTWTWCYALWSSMWEKVAVALFEAEVNGRVVIPKVDGPFFLIGFECKNWLLAVRT